MKPFDAALIVFFLAALGTSASLPAARAAGSDEESLASCCATEELLPPVRIEAGGAYIDTGKCIAHSGPYLADLDQDGRLDLLVGDFSGHIHFFKNTATNEAPAYAAGELLEADGKAIEVSNW